MVISCRRLVGVGRGGHHRAQDVKTVRVVGSSSTSGGRSAPAVSEWRRSSSEQGEEVVSMRDFDGALVREHRGTTTKLMRARDGTEDVHGAAATAEGIGGGEGRVFR